MSPEIAVILLRYGIIAFLYSFLGIILLLIVRDVRTSGKATKPQTEWGKLVVLETGRSDYAVGDFVTLEPVNFFGRAKSNSISLSDESVSSKHAMLAFRQKQWWIEDLGSTNGTFLNGHPILTSSVVTFGDVIEIGRTLFRFEKA